MARRKEAAPKIAELTAKEVKAVAGGAAPVVTTSGG